ncbi:MAG TPA: hypothetical protein VLH38_01380 [Patescibacteria group bacterium]|nr:hypothetical protein [Patescibacteria group bacterium]
MAIAVRSASSALANSGSVIVTRPAGVVSGDLLVALHFEDPFGSLAAMTAPAGWALVGTHTGASGNPFGKVWYKVAGGSEPASYIFGQDDTSVVVVVAISGQDVTVPVNVGPVWFDGGSAQLAHVAPDVTTTASGCLLLCAWSSTSDFALSYTPAGGMIEQGDITSAFVFGSVDSEVLGAAGSTGTRTATASSSSNNNYAAVSLAISPLGTSTSNPPSHSAFASFFNVQIIPEVFTLAPNTVPNPGQVGYLGKVNALTIIDGTAPTPVGTVWENGYLRVNADDVELSGYSVKGGIDCYGANLTVRNCMVEGNQFSFSAILIRNGTGTITDTTITYKTGDPPPTPNWGNSAIGSDQGTATVITRCDISGYPDGIGIFDSSLIEQNYIHGPALLGVSPNETHNDGIQYYGGSGLAIRYNRIDISSNGLPCDGVHQNGSIFIQPAGGSTATNPEIIGNNLFGGSITMRLEEPATGAVIQDNVFGVPFYTDVEREPGFIIASWSNNLDHNGTPIPQP